MKRRIRQNAWGNWKGYEGTRQTHCFGTDEPEAREWLAGREVEKPKIEQPIRLCGPGSNANHDPRR